jgi:peptidoglycan/xylan/chitin deacetylase (PgdA/CDA1 family)
MYTVLGAALMGKFRYLLGMMYIFCFVLAVGAIVRQASIYNSLVLRAADFTEVKRVALTFDDGPHPVYTPKLLAVLRERGVKVTFFVTGENASANVDIIKTMYEDGHLIGNHTYSHLQLTSYNRATFKEELVRTNDIIYEATGLVVSYVRPPYGTWDKGLEAELNMFPVLWNVDTLDWASRDAHSIAAKALKNISDNDVVLMHDYYASSVEAAIILVDTLLGQGYEFVTVDKILFD